MEDELKKYKTIMDNISDLAYVCDAKGNIVYVNKVFEKFTGYKPEQFYDKPFASLFDEENLQKGMDAYTRTLRGESPQYELCFKDTGTLCEYKNTPLRDKKEEIIGVVGIARDISERKRHQDERAVLNESLEQRVRERAEELSVTNENLRLEIIERKQMESALRESEQKYRRLIENLQENYFFYSHDTEGVFTHLSSSITNILGYTTSEFLTHYSEYLTDNSINQEVIHYTELSIKGIKQPAYPVEIYHKDGSIRILNVQEVPVFGKDNNVVAVEGIAEDITERKKLEATLMQSEKLMAMGVMTSGIAHEFNNILAIILGFAQLLKKGPGDDHNKWEKGIRIIIDAANDGAEIVRRMQDFTNLKKDPSKLVPVDIRALAKQVIDFTMPRWKNMALANGITYHIDLKGIREVPLTMGNPSELREVFTNLTNNALDAMSDGGTLSLCTWRENDNLFVSISDTGEGMCKSVRKKVFDPFFSTKMPEGSGLGLSSAFGIMRRHGGKITVKSEVGSGSTFTISLPICKALVSENAKNPTLETEANHLRILVVDDEQYICEFLREFLTDRGYYVKTVCCGREAIESLKVESFDLLLCGLVMPDVTGRDLVEFLDGLSKRPKVGLITGWNFKLQDAERERLKVDFVVTKPIDFTEILRCINNIF